MTDPSTMEAAMIIRPIFCIILFFSLNSFSGQQADIVNGIVIDEEEYPSVVRISELINGSPVAGCTATFVSSSTMLTAAHCVEDKGASVRVETGPAAGAVTKKIYLHPQYTLTGVYYDVAVVIFPEGTSPEYSTVLDRAAKVGNELTIVGYGRSKFDDLTTSGVKRKGFNVVSAVAERVSFTSKAPQGEGNGEDACSASGDSGGPMFIDDQIIGISSTISRIGAETTGNYSNILHVKYLPFFKDTIKKYGAEIHGLAL